MDSSANPRGGCRHRGGTRHACVMNLADRSAFFITAKDRRRAAGGSLQGQAVYRILLGRSFFLLQVKGSTFLRRRSGPAGGFPLVSPGKSSPWWEKRRGKRRPQGHLRVARRLPGPFSSEAEIQRMPVYRIVEKASPGPEGRRIFPRMSVWKPPHGVSRERGAQEAEETLVGFSASFPS